MNYVITMILRARERDGRPENWDWPELLDLPDPDDLICMAVREERWYDRDTLATFKHRGKRYVVEVGLNGEPEINLVL